MNETLHKLKNKKIWILLFILVIANIFSLWKDSNKFEFTFYDRDVSVDAAEYQKYLEDTVKNAKVMLLLGNAGSKDSFAYRNIQKTLEFYQNREAKTWEKSSTESIFRLFDNEMVNYLMLIFALLLATCLFEERKNGMWFLQRCYKNGRSKSLIHTIVAGIMAIGLAQIVLTITGYLFCGIKYGFTDLSLPIQSVLDHKSVVLDMSIAGYMICDVLVRIAGYSLVLLFAYFMLALIKKEILAILISIFVAGIEMLVYNSISMENALVYFKAINIWMVLRQDNIFKTYRNLNLFEIPVNLSIFALILLFIALAVLISLTVYICSKQYPVTGREGKYKISMPELVSRLLAKGGYLRLEFGKIFSQKGLLLIVVFLALMINELNINKVSFGEIESYRNSLYTEMQGMEIEEIPALVEKRKTDIEEKIADYQYRLEHLSEEEKWNKSAIEDMLKVLDKKKNVALDMEEYVQKLLECRGNDENVQVVNDLGYSIMLSISDKDNQFEISFILLLFIVLLVATAMPYENQRNMDILVHTSEYRSNTLIRSKIKTYSVLVILASIVADVVVMLRIKMTVGLDGLFCSVQSLKLFQHTNLHLQIWQLLFLMLLMEIVMSILIMVAVLVITSRMRKVAFAVVLSIIIFLLIPFVFMLGISVLEPLCINRFLCNYMRAKLWL